VQHAAGEQQVPATAERAGPAAVPVAALADVPGAAPGDEEARGWVPGAGPGVEEAGPRAPSSRLLGSSVLLLCAAGRRPGALS